jgi:hypothetical protein
MVSGMTGCGVGISIGASGSELGCDALPLSCLISMAGPLANCFGMSRIAGEKPAGGGGSGTMSPGDSGRIGGESGTAAVGVGGSGGISASGSSPGLTSVASSQRSIRLDRDGRSSGETNSWCGVGS